MRPPLPGLSDAGVHRRTLPEAWQLRIPVGDIADSVGSAVPVDLLLVHFQNFIE
jgi:hypothetical protein